GWARTYLKKYGLITNSERGVWSLAPEGQKTTSVDSSTVREYVRGLSRASPKKPSASEPSVLEDDGEVEHDWKDQLLAKLRTIQPAAFERLCQRLLRESGFIQVEVTGRSGDGGIDGHGIVRLAGLLSFPIIFQAKRYSGSVGAEQVRSFRGAMVGRADKGLFITTGVFTSAARQE